MQIIRCCWAQRVIIMNKEWICWLVHQSFMSWGMITICEEANHVLYNVSASGLFNQEIDISSARSLLDLITICSDQYFFSLACLEAYFLSSLDLKISAKFTSYRQYGTSSYIWNVKSWKKEGARFTTLCFCVTQSGLKIWCKLGRLKKLCKKNINVNMSQD